MASISLSQSTSSSKLLKKEPSSENNSLRPPKLGIFNRTKSSGELKNKINNTEGSTTDTTGVASTLQVPPIIVQSPSSPSTTTTTTTTTTTHTVHHQKAHSNSSFNLLKQGFNQISNTFSSNSGSISPRGERHSSHNMPNSPSSTTSPQFNGTGNSNLKGRNVASIIANNGASLNNSLNNIHQQQYSSGLSSSVGNISHNNISISSSGALNYNYTQQLNTSNNSSTGSMSSMNEVNMLQQSQDNGSNGTVGEVAHYSSMSSSIDHHQNKSMTETIEIMVVGDELSNKARFISSFLNNGIGEDPTLERFYPTKKSISIQSGAYNVNINTTVGQEEFWGINDVYYRSSQGFIFVYNVNSRESFLSFLKFRDKIIHEKGTENILMAMVGLTSPLVNESGEESSIREVTFTEAKRMSDLYSCSFIELNSFGLDCEHQIQSIVTDLLGRITNYQSSVNNNNNNNNNNPNSNSIDDSSLLSNTQQQSIEVLMLGDIFVGKSQIIQRLLGNPYQCTYKETTEWNKNHYQMTVNDQKYLLKIVDTCGINIEETLSRERLVSSQGFVFVYSIASRESFLMIEALRKKLQLIKGEGATKIPSVLIANKGDSLIRQVTFDEGSKMAQNLNSTFFEISSMLSDDESIVRPFEQLINDIQKSGNSSMELGEIKKKGYLFKEGKKLKSMSKYFFKVNKCKLTYCKNELNKGKVKTIELSEQIQLDIPNNNNHHHHSSSNSSGSDKRDAWPFRIITDPVSKQSINLIANTEEERNSWIIAIKFNCYLEEVASGILEETLKSFVSEIAQQQYSSSGNLSLSSSNLKRSDTVTSLPPNSPIKSNMSSGSASPMSSPYSSNNNLSQSSSISMSPQHKLQSVLLTNLSSSMNSSYIYSSSISSSYSSDSMSGSPPGSSNSDLPQSPQLKKTIGLIGRVNSFNQGKLKK